ncbi:XTP/dITP diphosphatase [Ornithinibacillus sp. 4-3]|uniref:dITP/XTP pyrophosphatase n=1 Tax=Ornithinibacillus sp. 4-3 TaxID=3231488 RepID=A0AB39HMP2_9BACI
MKKIIIATKNKGKAKEFAAFFEAYDIQAVSLLDMVPEIHDIAETGATFIENAVIKAEETANFYQQAVLADDSGLVIDALDGRPGVYSARYAGEQATDQANIDKVMSELAEVPLEDRTARFVCVLAIAEPGKETFHQIGYCEGKIAFEQKGMNGFGYDPIFIPNGYELTMAELSADEKNKISHRNDALEKLQAYLSVLK